MSTDCGTAKPSQTTQAHNYPIVSIIIPCRNEQAFIGGCLDSILENDFPKEQLEILVVDGMSEDGTGNSLMPTPVSMPFFSCWIIPNA